MESFLLQSSIALAAFYLLYRAVIVHESNQQLKRFMGLFIAIFCSSFLFLPSFEIASANEFPIAIQEALESASSAKATLNYEPKEQANTWILLYLVGAGIFAIRFLIGLFGLARLYLTSSKSKRWGFTLIETDKSFSPFSFFHLLFIKRGDKEKTGLDPIILHEQYHRDQLHSVDAVLLEILTIIFWFNPFMWLLQRDIKASHEFMADEYVILNKGVDKLVYQELLFEARTGVSFNSVNYLSNQTSLKQRFNMMENKKTHSKTSFLRAGIVLVAMALTVFITSFSTVPAVFSNDLPGIRLYTSEGEVNLEKGIPKTTDILHIEMVPEKESKIDYRISGIEATLVSKGRGLWTLRSNQTFQFGSRLSGVEKESILVVKVKEYLTKDENNIVEKVELEESIFIKIPVY